MLEKSRPCFLRLSRRHMGHKVPTNILDIRPGMTRMCEVNMICISYSRMNNVNIMYLCILFE